MRETFLKWMVPLLAGIAGCGGGEVAPSHRDVAKGALLTTTDFPGRVKVEGGLPSEPCGPVRIFEDNKGRTAESPMFNSNGVRIQEAVGAFPSEGLANLAFKTLISREHRTCIRNTMASFGRPQDSIRVTSLKRLQAGDQSALFRIHVIGPDSVKRGTVVVPSIQRGRCVSALIATSAGGKALRASVSDVVANADRALAHAC